MAVVMANSHVLLSSVILSFFLLFYGINGRFPFNKNYRFKFSEFSLVKWNASNRFPEFEVMCSVIQGMLGVFENGGLFKHFCGFRGG